MTCSKPTINLKFRRGTLNNINIFLPGWGYSPPPGGPGRVTGLSGGFTTEWRRYWHQEQGAYMTYKSYITSLRGYLNFEMWPKFQYTSLPLYVDSLGLTCDQNSNIHVIVCQYNLFTVILDGGVNVFYCRWVWRRWMMPILNERTLWPC